MYAWLQYSNAVKIIARHCMVVTELSFGLRRFEWVWPHSWNTIDHRVARKSNKEVSCRTHNSWQTIGNHEKKLLNTCYKNINY